MIVERLAGPSCEVIWSEFIIIMSVFGAELLMIWERSPRNHLCLGRFADDFGAIGRGDCLGVWSEILVTMSACSELLMSLERYPRKYECLERSADDLGAIGRADFRGDSGANSA